MDTTTKRVISLIAALGAFLTTFMASSVNIALPSIGKEFSMDAVMLSWMTTAYLLASAVFLVPFGKLADIYGRKKMFTLGIIIFTAASLVCSIAYSALILLLFRIIQGVGSAMLFSTGVAILTSAFPPEERGKAIGLNTSSTYLGLTGGPIIGGVLTLYFGWRSIFLVNVVLGTVAIVLIFLKLKGEWAEAEGEKLDLKGSIVYGVSLVIIIYGLSVIPDISGYLSICAGILLLILFVFIELRVKTPVLDMKLFKSNRVFAFSNLSAFINYSATFAVSFLLSLYLQDIKGFSSGKAGLVLASQPLVMTAFSVVAGRLSDKVESRKISSVGMFITSVSLFVISFIGFNTELPYIISGLMILGLGLAFFSSPNVHAIMNSVDRRFYGVASAVTGTMRLTGQMLSMGITMLIITANMGRVQMAPEHYGDFLSGLKVTMIFFAVLCFLGIFTSLARGKSMKTDD